MTHSLEMTAISPFDSKPIITGFSGKIYPDEYFVVYRTPCPRKPKPCDKYDKSLNDGFDYVVVEEDDNGRTKKTKIQIPREYEAQDYKIFNSPKSSQKPKAYGRGGISNAGKRCVRSSAAILEKKYARSSLSFVTCSLPNFRQEHISILAQHWDEVVRRYFQEIKRFYEAHNFSYIYVGVTEIQPERLATYDVIAPHIHYCIPGRANPRKAVWFMTANQCRAIWKRVLLQVLQWQGIEINYPVEWKACVHMTPIRKSVVHYLGKYLSKGGKITQKCIDAGRQEELPCHWWSVSASMRLLYKKSIIRMDANYASFIFNFSQDALDNGVLRTFVKISVPFGDHEIPVAVVGYLNEGYG